MKYIVYICDICIHDVCYIDCNDDCTSIHKNTILLETMASDPADLVIKFSDAEPALRQAAGGRSRGDHFGVTMWPLAACGVWPLARG